MQLRHPAQLRCVIREVALFGWHLVQIAHKQFWLCMCKAAAIYTARVQRFSRECVYVSEGTDSQTKQVCGALAATGEHAQCRSALVA